MTDFKGKMKTKETVQMTKLLLERFLTPQKIRIMNEKQITETAQLMFLQNSGRKDVIDFLAANNIVGEQAETIATNAYLAIKEQRHEMIETQEDQKAKGGIGTIIFGAVIMVAGIVASMNSDTLWYGAILVGLVTVIQGIASR